MAGPNQVPWYSRQFGLTRQQRARNMYHWDQANHYVQNMTQLRSGEVTATVRSQRFPYVTYAVRLDRPNSCQCHDFRTNAPLNPQFRCKHIMLLQMVYRTQRGRSLRAPIGGRVPSAKPIRVLMIGAPPTKDPQRPPAVQNWKDKIVTVLGNAKTRINIGQDRCWARGPINQDKLLGIVDLENYQELVYRWMPILFDPTVDNVDVPHEKPHSLLLNWDTGSGKTIASWLCLGQAYKQKGEYRKKIAYVTTETLAKKDENGPVKDAWAFYFKNADAQKKVETQATESFTFKTTTKGVKDWFHRRDLWRKNVLLYPSYTVGDANRNVASGGGCIYSFETFANLCKSQNQGGRSWYGIESQYSIHEHMNFELEFVGKPNQQIPVPNDFAKKFKASISKTILNWLPKETSDVLLGAVSPGKVKDILKKVKKIGWDYFSVRREDYDQLEDGEAEEWLSSLEIVMQITKLKELVENKPLSPLKLRALDKLNLANGNREWRIPADEKTPQTDWDVTKGEKPAWKQYYDAVIFIYQQIEAGNEKFRPLPFDPLRNAVVVIDEAHKIFSSTPDIDIKQRDVVKEFVFHSYKVSKNRAVRLILATATAANGSVTDAFELFNMLIPEEKNRFTENDNFDFSKAKILAANQTTPQSNQVLQNYFEKLKYSLSRVDVSKNFDQFPEIEREEVFYRVAEDKLSELESQVLSILKLTKAEAYRNAIVKKQLDGTDEVILDAFDDEKKHGPFDGENFAAWLGFGKSSVDRNLVTKDDPATLEIKIVDEIYNDLVPDLEMRNVPEQQKRLFVFKFAFPTIALPKSTKLRVGLEEFIEDKTRSKRALFLQAQKRRRWLDFRKNKLRSFLNFMGIKKDLFDKDFILGKIEFDVQNFERVCIGEKFVASQAPQGPATRSGQGSSQPSGAATIPVTSPPTNQGSGAATIPVTSGPKVHDSYTGLCPKLGILLEQIEKIDTEFGDTDIPPRHAIICNAKGVSAAPLVASALKARGYQWRPVMRTSAGKVKLAPIDPTNKKGVFVLTDGNYLDYKTEQGSGYFNKKAAGRTYANTEYSKAKEPNIGKPIYRRDLDEVDREEIRKDLRKRNPNWHRDTLTKEAEAEFKKKEAAHKQNPPLKDLFFKATKGNDNPHISIDGVADLKGLKGGKHVRYNGALNGDQLGEANKLLMAEFKTVGGDSPHIVVVDWGHTTGFDIENVEYVHLYDALEKFDTERGKCYSTSRIQSEGRAWRLCSHINLRKARGVFNTKIKVLEYRFAESQTVESGVAALEAISKYQEPFSGAKNENEDEDFTYDQIVEALYQNPNDFDLLKLIQDEIDVQAFDSEKNKITLKKTYPDRNTFYVETATDKEIWRFSRNNPNDGKLGTKPRNTNQIVKLFPNPQETLLEMFKQPDKIKYVEPARKPQAYDREQSDIEEFRYKALEDQLKDFHEFITEKPFDPEKFFKAISKEKFEQSRGENSIYGELKSATQRDIDALGFKVRKDLGVKLSFLSYLIADEIADGIFKTLSDTKEEEVAKNNRLEVKSSLANLLLGENDGKIIPFLTRVLEGSFLKEFKKSVQSEPATLNAYFNLPKVIVSEDELRNDFIIAKTLGAELDQIQVAEEEVGSDIFLDHVSRRARVFLQLESFPILDSSIERLKELLYGGGQNKSSVEKLVKNLSIRTYVSFYDDLRFDNKGRLLPNSELGLFYSVCMRLYSMYQNPGTRHEMPPKMTVIRSLAENITSSDDNTVPSDLDFHLLAIGAFLMTLYVGTQDDGLNFEDRLAEAVKSMFAMAIAYTEHSETVFVWDKFRYFQLGFKIDQWRNLVEKKRENAALALVQNSGDFTKSIEAPEIGEISTHLKALTSASISAELKADGGRATATEKLFFHEDNEEKEDYGTFFKWQQDFASPIDEKECRICDPGLSSGNFVQKAISLVFEARPLRLDIFFSILADFFENRQREGIYEQDCYSYNDLRTFTEAAIKAVKDYPGLDTKLKKLNFAVKSFFGFKYEQWSRVNEIVWFVAKSFIGKGEGIETYGKLVLEKLTSPKGDVLKKTQNFVVEEQKTTEQIWTFWADLTIQGNLRSKAPLVYGNDGLLHNLKGAELVAGKLREKFKGVSLDDGYSFIRAPSAASAPGSPISKPGGTPSNTNSNPVSTAPAPTGQIVHSTIPGGAGQPDARIESFAADTTFTIEEPSHLRGIPMSARKVQTMVWEQDPDPECLRAVAGTKKKDLVVRLSLN